ncbi:TerC family protein [Brevibacillus massiliensis]|uniref:TerC family protein n=1 Tax=Brevibacillus massiliensis TaxID=1118054 RepID=UPI0002D9AF6E|nr:TerC family protein [Brevibacillus massiliensis]
MLETTFLGSLLLIIAIDIILGGDNAVVIAMASRKLPAEQKKKAVIWGTCIAVVIRVLATIAAALLLKIPFLYLVGGLLLAWIAFKLLLEDDEEKEVKAGDSLLQAIKTIVFADVLMGLDNVLAIAGAAKGEISLIVIGLLISIPVMVWGSSLILKAMERFPWIVYVGSGILAWTAARMITHEHVVAQFLPTPWLLYGFELLIVIGIIATGFWKRNRTYQTKKKRETEQKELVADDIAAGS